jgi:hypothetical protein
MDTKRSKKIEIKQYINETTYSNSVLSEEHINQNEFRRMSESLGRFVDENNIVLSDVVIYLDQFKRENMTELGIRGISNEI